MSLEKLCLLKEGGHMFYWRLVVLSYLRAREAWPWAKSLIIPSVFNANSSLLEVAQMVSLRAF